jgi:hypothetical protein
MDIFSSLIEKQDADKLSRYIEQLADCLVNPTNAVPLTRTASFSDKQGVYCIFEHDELIYVGETGSLKERMKDIFRTMNHSFRRSLGKRQFANVAGVSEANSKTNFPFDVELQLTEYMESNIRVALTPVAIGRKEVEEIIVKKHAPVFNSRGQRGQL